MRASRLSGGPSEKTLPVLSYRSALQGIRNKRELRDCAKPNCHQIHQSMGMTEVDGFEETQHQRALI
jgi:hypothetical protein